MKRLELLKELTLAAGISGHEREITNIMVRELSSYQYSKDRLGNITFSKGGGEGGKKLLFIAHQDEIGFIVAEITPQGFLGIQNIGGWDMNTLQSSPVEVINKDGKRIRGIIGSVPVHFQTGGPAKLSLEGMFIDIGASSHKEAVEVFGIELGAAVGPVCRFVHVQETQRLFSKAFDDRVGIGAVIELGKEIEGRELSNTIYMCGSVQEEVGTRGAQAISGYTDADVCFVLEGAPADDIPGIPGQSQTRVGKGVHVRLYDPTLLVPETLKVKVKEIAEKNNIPIQLTVRRRGGTDGRQIHTANRGIPTIVLGIPVRFAHSHNSHISLIDYENLINLCCKLAEEF